MTQRLTPHLMLSRAFSDELRKIAATRALKNVKAALREGGPEAADALARRYSSSVRRQTTRPRLRSETVPKKPRSKRFAELSRKYRGGQRRPDQKATGSHLSAFEMLFTSPLKRTDFGSMIGRPLGAGVEGTAVMTVGQDVADGGLAVAKAYNPQGYLFDPAMLEKKVRDWRAIRRKGDKRAKLLSKMYSPSLQRRGGVPFHHTELVTGRSLGDTANEIKRKAFRAVSRNKSGKKMPFRERVRTAREIARFDKQVKQLADFEAKASPSPNTYLRDIATNPENVIFDKKTGKPKVIDFIPVSARGQRRIAERMKNNPFRRRGSSVGLTRNNERAWGVDLGVNINPQGQVQHSPRDVLSRLGPGSRQPKKNRGGKK